MSSSLSLCGDVALESIRPEVSRLVGFLLLHMRPLRLLSLLGGLCEPPQEKGAWLERPMAQPIMRYSAFAYLNADFTGGELVFPDVM